MSSNIGPQGKRVSLQRLLTASCTMQPLPHTYLWPLMLRRSRWSPFPPRSPRALPSRRQCSEERSGAFMASNEQPLADVSFLTVAEVATKMRVSKMTVYRLVHNGELPAVRVGRSFRVPEEAVNEYLGGSYIDAG